MSSYDRADTVSPPPSRGDVPMVFFGIIAIGVGLVRLAATDVGLFESLIPIVSGMILATLPGMRATWYRNGYRDGAQSIRRP